MRRKMLIDIAAIIVTLVIAVYAPFSTRAATGPLESLQKVRVGLGGPITSLDPASAQDPFSYQPGVLIAGQLFRFDAKRQPQPDLVESYQMSPDGLTYTMTLRQGLKYSDGTPLTIEDVLYNWNRIKESPAVDKTLIKNVTGLDASNGTTLTWTLSSPEPDFIEWFGLHYLQIHPKSKVEADKDYFKHPVSAGPYYLKDWTAESALLEENPNYARGPMAIKQIEIVSIPDVTARTLRLAQGDLDYVFDLAPSVQGIITGDVKTAAHGLGGMLHIVFNMALPKDRPLANRDVREAISLAIDRDAVSKRAFFGVSSPATGFLYPGEALLPNLPNGGNRDLQAAKALLAKTPFKDGFEFTLGVWGNHPGWQEAAQVIQENLRDLRINARIEALDDEAAIRKLVNGDFDAQISENVAYPPRAFLTNLYLPGGNWASWARYNNPDMAALFDAARSADPQKRIEALHQIQALAYKDMPFVIIGTRSVLTGTRIPGDLLVACDPGDYLVVKTAAGQ
jgi:peptide/nickel transport system substrate-binding protein